MARANWLGSPHAKIESHVGEAHDLRQLAMEGKSFDVDKPGYFALYEMMARNLLKVKGLLVVDNVM